MSRMYAIISWPLKCINMKEHQRGLIALGLFCLGIAFFFMLPIQESDGPRSGRLGNLVEALIVASMFLIADCVKINVQSRGGQALLIGVSFIGFIITVFLLRGL
jgi:hypothetical protein